MKSFDPLYNFNMVIILGFCLNHFGYFDPMFLKLRAAEGIILEAAGHSRKLKSND